MKQLLEAINRGILKGLTESNIEILSGLDDDNLDLMDSLLTKSINSKVDYSIKRLLIDAIQTGELHTGLKLFINDPNNFSELKGLITANDTIHLKQLIKIGQALFGNDGNFNLIDTSKITDMSRLFYNSYFNGHIELWNVSNVTDMKLMFYSSNFNLSIGDWDVSNVVDMGCMFCCAYKFNLPIGNWNVSNVTTMFSMFYCAEKFNLPLNNWVVRDGVNINYVFQGCPIKEEYKFA